jgi:hypothetical protein
MCNKYIFSLTSIPSRIKGIEKTIDSLMNQTLKPEKIILNIPKKYNFRFNEYPDISALHINLKKFTSKIIINIVDNDYGPGTKLLGITNSNVINIQEDNTFIVLVDDDLVYKPYMLEYFDRCNSENYNNKCLVASFYCYNHNEIIIGQGADGLFIKSHLLDNFNKYYNIINTFEYINYHDDYYISYYFHIKKIRINYFIAPYNKHIYDFNYINQNNALVEIKGKNSRTNLNYNIYRILTKLNFVKLFDI